MILNFSISSPAPISELQDKSKHNFAYQQLKQWIIQGEMPPDTILVERQLCEILHLSRTPIRSALQELAQEGFVMNAPGRGMMVSRVQIEDVIEIFEIRQSLDVLALELFMKNPIPSVVAAMGATVDTMRTALEQGSGQDFITADSLFHELYSRNTGNRRLEKIWLDLCEQERRIVMLTINDPTRMKMAYDHHVEIFSRIDRCDVPGALEQLRLHLHDAMEYHIRKMSRR